MRIYDEGLQTKHQTVSNKQCKFGIFIQILNFKPLQYVTDILEDLRKESSTYGGMGHIYAV